MFAKTVKLYKTNSGYNITRLISGRSNVYMLSNNSCNILIDTGTATNWKKLKRGLNILQISNIDLLILTHTHYDHAANAANIKKYFGVKVLVQAEGSFYITNGINKFPGGTNFFTRFIVNFIGNLVTTKFNFAPCGPDIIVNDKYYLTSFGFNAYLLPTPGHSSDSISIIVDNQVAIVGDTLFGVFKNSVYPPFADNVQQMIISWKKLIDTGCSLFLSGHGGSIGLNKLKNGYQKYVK